VYEAVNRSSMLAHLEALRVAQAASEDVLYAAPRLRELRDPRGWPSHGGFRTLTPPMYGHALSPKNAIAPNLFRVP
jgi:hypothetical protein